jgi:hypothetical protein
LDGSFLGLDLPSGKIGAVVGNRQLEIPHAEIESSEMMLHPRLQLMLFYGGRVAPNCSAILVNSFSHIRIS